MVPESDGAHDAGSRAARFNWHRERPLSPHPGPLPPRERERFLHLLSLDGTGRAFNHSSDDSSIASIFS